jgi:hypothetical protein
MHDDFVSRFHVSFETSPMFPKQRKYQLRIRCYVLLQVKVIQ